MHPLISIIISVITSILAVKWAYFKILKLAKMKNLVDNPDARKLQKEPVPVMGGMAVFFGVICGMTMCTTMIPPQRLGSVLLSGAVMFFVGMLDDFLGLSPRIRFLFQILCVVGLVYCANISIDNLQGLWGIYQLPVPVALGLTVFAGVGIINAINMIDGVNGLSSGLCILCSLLFAYIFYLKGDYANACLGCCMAASLFLFLLHNVFGATSKMFIGDSGTMMMGITVIWYVMNLMNSQVMIQHTLTHFAGSAAACALAIESVPVFDTLRVMIQRIMEHKSPFSPDKTHLHHMFIQLGVSHSITALSIIGIDLLIVILWFASYRLGFSLEGQLYTVIAAGVVLVWGCYSFLHYQNHHQTRFSQRLRSFSLASHKGHTPWWQSIQRYLDKE